MKKSRVLSALMAGMFLLFAAMPVTARASTADELADQINGFVHGGTGTLLAIVPSDNIVSVISFTPITEVKNKLCLNIGYGVTVIWKADYTSSPSFSDFAMIELTGSGTFEIAANGSVRTLSDSHTILGLYGCSTAIISSGTVSAIDGFAIATFGPVTVNGGTISSENLYSIFATMTKITINKGTVRTATGIAVYAYDSIVNINGGAIYNVNEGFAILTTGYYAKAIVNGGFIFSNSRAIVGAASLGQYTLSHFNSAPESKISGDAVVCAWKKPAGSREYTEKTKSYLLTNTGASAKWVIRGDKQGIYYAKGANTGFYAMGTDNVSIKPAAPSNLTATTGAGGITLKWTNNSGSVSYNRVNRKEGGSEWSAIATIPASATKYIDNTAAVSKTYTYNVAAYAATGVAGVSDEALIYIPGPAYRVTVINGKGSGKFEADAAVSIKANAAAAGMAFDRWTSADGVTFASETSPSTTFIMPPRAVTVTATYKPAKVKVTGVKTLPALYLVKGKTVALPAAAQPHNATDKALTWKSANTSIATVDPMTGKVKGIKIGTTSITVTSGDGKKAAKCAVNVVSKSTALKTLKITPGTATTLVTGSVLQVIPKLTPANATGIVPKFSSGKPKVALIDKAGMITALSPGKTTITVTAGGLKKAFDLSVED